ncbi:MAG: hypothetical protein II007_13375 [Gammaproteobacteria bacterium]|nr:hypothetical protein [Gammaproteobacteria bacterium]
MSPALLMLIRLFSGLDSGSVALPVKVAGSLTRLPSSLSIPSKAVVIPSNWSLTGSARTVVPGTKRDKKFQNELAIG